MAIKSVSPAEALRLMKAGAMLVDIRGADEHRREHIPGAVNVSVDGVGSLAHCGKPLVFHCRSGMRTSMNALQLDAASAEDCYVLDGGLEAWKRAGQDVRLDRRQPLEINRQVQLVAGSVIVISVLLGFAVDPAYSVLAAFIGCGLVLAGSTGWCGLARLLLAMPWNRNGAPAKP